MEKHGLQVKLKVWCVIVMVVYIYYATEFCRYKKDEKGTLPCDGCLKGRPNKGSGRSAVPGGVVVIQGLG